MTTDSPSLARPALDFCSLSGSELADRLARIRTEILPHAVVSQTLPDGFAWEFEAGDAIETQLEELAALERQCCAELDFTIWRDARQGRVRFEARGADPSSEAILSLSNEHAEKVPTQSKASAFEWRSLAKRLGVSGLLALFVCCVLPIGLTALAAFAGLTIAAPLLSLDNPWFIASATIAFTVLLTLLDRARKNRARTEPNAGSASSSEPQAEGCGC